jgi:hypothetical protein
MKKPKRTAIKQPKRTAIKYGRNHLGIRMFECFGRWHGRELTPKETMIAKKRRRKYLLRYGKKLDLRKQTLSQEDKECLAIK